MQSSAFSRKIIALLVGDAITLALVTLAGLGFHNELSQVGARFFPNFLPLWIGWLLLAPHLQAYSPDRAVEPRSLWRPFWAMILSAPFGLWLRSLILGTAVIPVFVLVMGGISALGILAWRGVYLIVTRQTNASLKTLESTQRHG